jgi:lysophospholipase L1-like esterase
MKFNGQRVFACVAIILIVILAGTSIFEFAQLRSDPIRVACVGDSITVGFQYPVDLWQSLGDHYIVGDLGSGGAAVAENSNMSYIGQPAYEVALKFQPDIVIIMLGTNDAYTTFTENDADFITDYVSLIHTFQNLNSKPTVWLVKPIPIYNNTVSLSNTILEQKVIPNIEQVASQTGCQLIDAHTPLLNHPEYYIDGVHPTADGARVIADTIYAALTSKN